LYALGGLRVIKADNRKKGRTERERGGEGGRGRERK